MTIAIDERRKIGRTALSLPVLGLGTCPLGGVYSAVSDEAAQAVFATAWRLGIRLYDTSPWYGLGLAEHRCGRALYYHPRAGYTLTTKVGRVLHRPVDSSQTEPSKWAGGLAFDYRHAFTYDAIMRSYEDSLQRLGINQVDIVYIHDLDTGYFPQPHSLNARLKELEDGGFRALEELKKHGDIKAIGAGINERGMINRFLDRADLDVFLIASRYTLLEHEIYFDEIKRAAQRGASIVAGGVFNSGILATGAVAGAKYEYAGAPAAIRQKVHLLSTIAHEFNVALPAAALQFPLAADNVASVIFGAVSADEVEQNVGYFTAAIPAAFWAALKERRLIHPDIPVPH